ncbi:MAG: hypothetical protein ACLSBH_14420 [Coprobacillus cateniformis]
MDGTIELSGQNALQEAKHWSKRIAKELSHLVAPQDDIFPYHHIGCAETGSSDYLGPLCIVSCYVTSEDSEFLKSLHIEDLNSLSIKKL